MNQPLNNRDFIKAVWDDVRSGEFFHSIWDELKYDSLFKGLCLSVFWIFLILFLLSERAGAEEPIPIEELPPGEYSSDEDSGPRYYLVYEFYVSDPPRWQKLIFPQFRFHSLIDCQELGSATVKSMYHEHSRFECIPSAT